MNVNADNKRYQKKELIASLLLEIKSLTMKKVFVLFFFVLEFNSVFSQQFPVPAIGAEWNNSELDYGDAPFPRTYTTRMEIEGDTVIESHLYFKAYSTWQRSYMQTGFCDFIGFSEPTYSGSYLGGIRSDEKNRVFYWGAEDSTERLLYDFSAETGDSVILDGLDGKYATIIEKTDSVLIGESYRKELYLTSYNGLPDHWIEGIGSTYGFFATLSRGWEFVDYELTCYKENNVKLYAAQSGCTKCDIVTSEASGTIRENISVSPNPIVDRSQVTWSDSIKPVRLEVYDLQGRQIYCQPILNSNSTILYNHDLTRGILILQLVDDHDIRYNFEIIAL